MSARFRTARLIPLGAVLVLVGVSLFWNNPASAAQEVRINAGGPAQSVDGTSWTGCTAISACSGYVTGGFPWTENAAAPSGYVSPDSQTIEKSEWSGGSTNGVAYGATAFTFNVPVSGSSQYDVKLHFTENNKTAAGQRVFDVKINGATVLTNFDIFQQAGGEFKTIVRTFTVPAVNGAVSIAFVRKTENAKISAIEVIGKDTSGPTTTSTSTTSSTTTTSTTAPPSGTGKLTWSAIANSPKAAVEATSNAIDNKLYVFGGYYNNVWVPAANAYSYDTTTNTWTTLPNVPRGLTHAATVVNGRNLIVAGGYSANGSGGQIFAINNVYSFNVDSKTWSSLPSLPAARGSGALAKVNNTLHFLGGVDTSRKEQGSHWTLDLNNQGAGWQNAPAFPYPRTHFPAVTVGTSIYTIGGLVGIDAGSTELGGVYRYDTTTGQWSTRASLPVPLSHMSDSTVLYGGKIWIFGGEPKYGQSASSVYVYDPNANSWSTNTSLPSGRFSGNAVNIGGTFYFANGTQGSTMAWKGALN